MKSGGAEVTASGTVGSYCDLAFRATAADTGELLAESAGKIEASGTLFGPLSAPEYRLEVNGKRLVYQDIELESVLVAAKGKLAQDAETIVSGTLGKSRYSGQNLDEGELHFSGNVKRHDLTVHAVAGDISLGASLHGGLEGQSWQGRLTDTHIAHTVHGDLKQREDAGILLGLKKGELDGLCLSHKAGALCLKGGYSGSDWRAEVDFSELDPGYYFEGWNGALRGRLNGRGNFENSRELARLSITELNGMIGGQTVSGRGHAVVQSDAVHLEELTLAVGGAQASARGAVGDTCLLELSAEIPDLGGLFPDSAGQLSLTGRVSGRSVEPEVSIEFILADALYAQSQIKKLQGDVSFTPKEGGAEGAYNRQ